MERELNKPESSPGLLHEFSMATDALFDISMIQELTMFPKTPLFLRLVSFTCDKRSHRNLNHDHDIRNGPSMALERLITSRTSSRYFVDLLHI